MTFLEGGGVGEWARGEVEVILVILVILDCPLLLLPPFLFLPLLKLLFLLILISVPLVFTNCLHPDLFFDVWEATHYGFGEAGFEGRWLEKVGVFLILNLRGTRTNHIINIQNPTLIPLQKLFLIFRK